MARTAGRADPQPTKRHLALLAVLLDGANASAEVVPDAHLAALAAEHGLAVANTDGDFARFREVRWVDPRPAERGTTGARDACRGEG